jgi:hypothetical protein
MPSFATDISTGFRPTGFGFQGNPLFFFHGSGGRAYIGGSRQECGDPGAGPSPGDLDHHVWVRSSMYRSAQRWFRMTMVSDPLMVTVGSAAKGSENKSGTMAKIFFIRQNLPL